MGNYCTFMLLSKRRMRQHLRFQKNLKEKLVSEENIWGIISLNKPLNRFKGVKVLIQHNEHLDVVHNLIGLNCNYKWKSASLRECKGQKIKYFSCLRSSMLEASLLVASSTAAYLLIGIWLIHCS